MLPSSITAIMLAAILFLGFLPSSSSLATAQPLQQLQQQQQQTTTTPSPPSSSLSITTIPPLTPQELEQQNRLQSTIAATTRDLNETEKEVSGVVFTPRWSDVAWINANSISVLIAYCLPGEFADSGQEILGGFGLEVLESYAVDLPQGFMAWMAVVGNQDDVQNGRRLPAALGVICASDLNRADTRILSPQEQQQINNINQQFSTIQNTQITNIDQVINIIDDVTTPTQNGTGGGGGGMTPPPPTTHAPLTVEIIPNATSGFIDDNLFELKTKVTGGTEPYNYSWTGPPTDPPDSPDINVGGSYCYPDFVDPSNLGEPDPSCIWVVARVPGTYPFSVTVTDSKNQTASDTVQIVTRERLRGPDLGVLDNATVQGEGFRAGIIANATQAYTGSTIKFDASIRGGAPPYSYSWSSDLGLIDQDRSITLNFFEPGTFTYILTATDSNGQTASDSIQITVEERPGGVLPPPETGGEGQPPGTLLPGIAPGGGEEEPGIPPTVPEEGEPTTGGGEDTSGTPPSTEEEEPPSPPDDTGEEGEGTPPSTTEEEPTSPPEGGG
jgi:hypothetical protein